jgi:hypothetical protein
MGVGLQRTTSGTDKKGRPKPARLKLPWAVNRTGNFSAISLFPKNVST